MHKMAYRKAYATCVWDHAQLVGLSLHAALTKKRKISDGRASVWCVDCSYMPYTLESCLLEMKKEEEERKKKSKIEIFTFNFLNCYKSWNSGAILYTRGKKFYVKVKCK